MLQHDDAKKIDRIKKNIIKKIKENKKTTSIASKKNKGKLIIDCVCNNNKQPREGERYAVHQSKYSINIVSTPGIPYQKAVKYIY